MARSRIRYKRSPKGTRELLSSAQMLAVMMAAAQAGKVHAESISPRRSGHYAESFRIDGRRHGGPRRDRAEARVINDAEYGAAVEARHDVLGRTVDYIEATDA